MVLHDTSHKPFSFRIAAADRHLSFERFRKHFSTILLYGLIHLAVTSPSFPSWQLSLTENQCRSVMVGIVVRIAVLDIPIPTLL